MIVTTQTHTHTHVCTLTSTYLYGSRLAEILLVDSYISRVQTTARRIYLVKRPLLSSAGAFEGMTVTAHLHHILWTTLSRRRPNSDSENIVDFEGNLNQVYFIFFLLSAIFMFIHFYVLFLPVLRFFVVVFLCRYGRLVIRIWKKKV